jgi:hypothetical protein
MQVWRFLGMLYGRKAVYTAPGGTLIPGRITEQNRLPNRAKIDHL